MRFSVTFGASGTAKSLIRLDRPLTLNCILQYKISWYSAKKKKDSGDSCCWLRNIFFLIKALLSPFCVKTFLCLKGPVVCLTLFFFSPESVLIFPQNKKFLYLSNSDVSSDRPLSDPITMIVVKSPRGLSSYGHCLKQSQIHAGMKEELERLTTCLQQRFWSCLDQ